jgi:site-specific recombinase XerD
MDTLANKNDYLQTIFNELEKDPAIKSANTRRGYKTTLAEFETWRNGRKFTRTLVGEYAAQLQTHGLTPATVNYKLSAVRWWARRMVELAHEADMTNTQRREVITQAERVASIANVKGDRHTKTGRHITSGEIDKLFETLANDDTPAGIRDAAMFAIMRSCGLRRSELVGLTMADITAHDILMDELVFDVRIASGKGDKTRTIPVNNGAALALVDWLLLRGNEPGPLFYAIRKGGEITTHGISADAFRQVQEKRTREAGLQHVMLHDWRKTFAGDLLDKNVDIATVADLMGHSSVETTRKYDRRGDERKRQAVRGLFVPYRSRENGKNKK